MLYNYLGKEFNPENPEDMLRLTEEVFDDLSTDDQVCYWNDYCGLNNKHDNWIYPMEELEDILEGVTGYEVLTRSIVDLENFNSAHDYFTFTIYGLTSSNDIYDLQSPLDEEGFMEFILKKIEANPYNYDVEIDDDEDNEE